MNNTLVEFIRLIVENSTDDDVCYPFILGSAGYNHDKSIVAKERKVAEVQWAHICNS